MMRATRLLTTAAAVLFTVAACSKEEPKRQAPSVPVRVATAQRLDAPITITASGVVEPVQTVNVEAQTSGSVLEVAFRQGDYVHKGQVLFRLDPRPLQGVVEQARAVLARDQAQATASQHDAERYTSLAAKGYVTQSQAEQMQATAAAQAATVTADRAALQNAEVTLGYATIRAPIDGRTGALLVRQGNLVSPGSGPLVVINQLRPIEIRFPVLPQDFQLLSARGGGVGVPVTATSSDSGTVSENGELTFLDNAVDSLTGTVTGRARFANASSHLWPGQLVFLSVQAGVQRNVLAVPTPAVQIGQQGTYVYVVDPQKMTAQTRNVSTGRNLGDLTIVTMGLVAGEQVVTDGQSRLNPGSHVTIIKPGKDSAQMNPGGDTANAGVAALGGGGTASAATGSAGGGATVRSTADGSLAPATRPR
ncbi:MAG: efflux RND transporter periplasmic adaptor subunit [Gemmatimonadaceae bacterium]